MFSVYELLTYILEEMIKPDDEYSPDCYWQFDDAARVCRTWKEVALRAQWRTTGLERLLRALVPLERVKEYVDNPDATPRLLVVSEEPSLSSPQSQVID